MSKIFISYKREERERVRLIAEALGRAGYDVYWDTRLRASAQYIQQLNAELLSADCVLVAWCDRSIASAWVMAECLKALNRGNLLPVRIDNVHDNSIPAPFNAIHTLDLIDWRGDEYDRRWLQLKDDVRHVVAGRSSFKPVEIREEDDEEAMSTEILSQVARSELASPLALTAEPEAGDLGSVKALIKEMVDKGGGSVPHASVAQALIDRWPSKAGRFNWFGHKRFSHLFAALAFPDLKLDTSGRGTITRAVLKPQSPIPSTSSTAAPPAKPAPAPPSMTAGEPLATFGDRIFSATGAPNLPPKTYGALFHAIAATVQSGATTLSDVGKRTRDALAGTPNAVSRERANFVTKGALIGGLKLDFRPMLPVIVATFYANSLLALCKANGVELTSLEQDRLLELLGFGDI